MQTHCVVRVCFLRANWKTVAVQTPTPTEVRSAAPLFASLSSEQRCDRSVTSLLSTVEDGKMPNVLNIKHSS